MLLDGRPKEIGKGRLGLEDNLGFFLQRLLPFLPLSPLLFFSLLPLSLSFLVPFFLLSFLSFTLFLPAPLLFLLAVTISILQEKNNCFSII